MTSGETLGHVHWVLHHDGTPFPVFATSTPVFDAGGALTTVITVATDISDRIEADEQRSAPLGHRRVVVGCDRRDEPRSGHHQLELGRHHDLRVRGARSHRPPRLHAGAIARRGHRPGATGPGRGPRSATSTPRASPRAAFGPVSLSLSPSSTSAVTRSASPASVGTSPSASLERIAAHSGADLLLAQRAAAAGTLARAGGRARPTRPRASSCRA